MYNYENFKVYVPDAEKGYLRDKTDDHFYFNIKGEENAPEIYVHDIKKNKNGNSYEVCFPAVEPVASYKLVTKFTPNP